MPVSPSLLGEKNQARQQVLERLREAVVPQRKGKVGVKGCSNIRQSRLLQNIHHQVF